MGILDTFSKRQKQVERAGRQDVYEYGVLPAPFRVQVIHIWKSGARWFLRVAGYSSGTKSPANKFWKFIHDGLARELGVFSLGDGRSDPDDQCKQYLLTHRPWVPSILLSFHFA